MSKTITISVSDELYVLIQQFKQRMSVSKICQEALMEQINRLQTAETGDLIAFLKGSKAAFTEEFRKDGQRFARECIKEKIVDYANFITLTELAEGIKKYPVHVAAVTIETVKDALEEGTGVKLWEMLENYAEGQKKYIKGFDVDAFLVGFVYEIDVVWQKLKDKL